MNSNPITRKDHKVANIERIKQVVALIEEDVATHEGKHFDMDTWVGVPESPDVPAFCNTTMCFAGWAAVAQMGSMSEFLKKAVTLREFMDWNGKPTGTHAWETTQWANEEVEDIANAWMGLTPQEGNTIFYATWIDTVEDLKRHITNTLKQIIWPEITYF